MKSVYKKLGNNSLERKQAVVGYLFVLPNFIGFLIFIFIPVFASLILSFFDWNLVNPLEFTGLTNYFSMFKRSLFQKTFINTVYYTLVTVPLSVMFGLLLAVLVNNIKKMAIVYKFIFFLPSLYLQLLQP
ncbi:MAG: sugar ABC transporter permease [Firmicutes bacterium]|nr:sugar ABC transporter permease [Bacillota bacterium]